MYHTSIFVSLNTICNFYWVNLVFAASLFDLNPLFRFKFEILKLPSLSSLELVRAYKTASNP